MQGAEYPDESVDLSRHRIGGLTTTAPTMLSGDEGVDAPASGSGEAPTAQAWTISRAV